MIDVSKSGHYIGDCRALLRELADGCVQTCVTSIPYWKKRDYGHQAQLGLEETVDEFIANQVDVFHEVHRVLRDDGTLWINVGDTAVGSWGANGRHSDNAATDIASRQIGAAPKLISPARVDGLVDKEIVGVPWRLAFALQADGWRLRQDIIWDKPNPTPEPVADRCTRSHEYIFMFWKGGPYYYDADAIRTPLSPKTLTTFGNERRAREIADPNVKSSKLARDVPRRRAKVDADGNPVGANKRSVWSVAGGRYPDAHFATFPPALIEPCILAGAPPGGVVLDPFFGSGTTGEVAEKHGRKWIGFDINPAYEALQKQRTAQRSLALGGNKE
jgi:DNA modification methylase